MKPKSVKTLLRLIHGLIAGSMLLMSIAPTIANAESGYGWETKDSSPSPFGIINTKTSMDTVQASSTNNVQDAAVPSSDWGMSAANPQRTSWVSGATNELRGNLKVEWYRVFDPYIDNKVQVIASDGKVFVSTSKGLFAFNASDGTQSWAYGTELPLGNSPTYLNGILYVGGYDHKIHAVHSSNGQVKTGWAFFEAGAGYETNPLAISDTYTGNQPVILAGNRDGYFYALDGNDGSLKWKYKTGGPIRFSAAYKNGVVYFAADDSYAYALNVSDGSLVWKSAKFPGAGFDNYWPVIYTDPASGKDYVLYSGSKKASWAWFYNGSSLYFSENYEMYESQSGCTGTTTLDCSLISNYMATHQWKRNLFILDRNTGAEYTTPYAPVNWAGVTHNGNKYPPVVAGNGQLYSFIGYNNGGNNGANGWIAQWKIGSSDVTKIYNNFSGAADEPVAFTSGGNLIYWGEGVNADTWGTIDLTKPIGSNYYSWQDVRSMPGAGEKYTSLDLTGKFGGTNGVYGYFDGLNNLSPVPYNKKLYIINGNALFALSTTGGSHQLATVQTPTAQASGVLSTSWQGVQERLENEIQKMLTAGHLRPGYADSGIPSSFLNFHGNQSVPGNHLGEYFHNPADTLYTLAVALPYLSPTLQTQVKTYLQQEQANYPVDNIAHIGWKNGSPREAFIDPPELTDVFNHVISDNGNNAFVAAPRNTIWYPNPCCNTYMNVGSFPPDSFYGAWKYAQVFPNQAKSLFDKMKSKLQKAGVQNDMTDANLITYPYILNQYIAGYRGYLELEKLAGYTTDITKSNQYVEYTRLLNLRLNNFSKDAPIWPGEDYNNNLSVARNFMFMVPELADAFRTSKLPQVQQALAEYQTIEPYWFVSRYDRTFNEGVFQPLYDYHALFQARAYILQLPFSELVKHLDVPAFEKGDLFYIQNLVSLLQSSGSTLVIYNITRNDPSPTNAASVNFTVTFTEPVTGVDIDDFVLTTTGVSGASIAGVSGSGAAYKVAVNTGSGKGTIRLDVKASGTGIQDLSGNDLVSGYTFGEVYTIDKTITIFGDVFTTHWAWQYIEKLHNAGITGGCTTNPLNYCPENDVTRAQMAVFLEKGAHYPAVFTAPNLAPTFDDTAGHWAEDWIEALRSDGITSGCTAGSYCPDNPVTRAQMAVFLLKASHGSSYTPPAVGASTDFGDVPADHWASAWIKQLAAESITSGCGGGNYCPESPVTRAQMAVFLVKTFNLP